MATLTVEKMDWDGLSPTGAAASSGGDQAPCGPGRFLYVSNASTGSVTVTVATPGTVRGAAIEDAAPSVAAGAVHMLPLLKTLYADSDGLASVTYSASASVTVAVVEMPR